MKKDRSQIKHVAIFGGAFIFACVKRPWWVALIVLVAGLLFFPIRRDEQE